MGLNPTYKSCLEVFYVKLWTYALELVPFVEVEKDVVFFCQAGFPSVVRFNVLVANFVVGEGCFALKEDINRALLQMLFQEWEIKIFTAACHI